MSVSCTMSFRIVLAILAAAARCFRAHPVTNGQDALKHLRTQVTAAELFYLRHLRTCAASSSGSRSTCSAATPCLYTSGQMVVLDCIMLLVKVMLQSTPQILQHLKSMFAAVLQSMPSPLEICAFIVVVHLCEGKNCFHWFQVSDFKFQISDFRFQVSYFRFPEANGTGDRKTVRCPSI